MLASMNAWARSARQGLLVLAGMACLGVQAQTAAPLTVSCSTSPNVVNTAYNHATQGYLAAGQNDPYWGIAYAGSQAGGAVPTPLASIGAGAWINPVVYWTTPWSTSPYSNANWIAPYAGSAGAGGQAWRYYRYRFNLDPSVNPADLSLQLSYYADDVITDIYINGVSQSTHGAVQAASWVSPGSHTLALDWQSGTNEVVFLVRDSGWVTGLMVQALPSATCRPTPVDVTKTASASQVTAGDSLSYTISLLNQGSQSATVSNLTDPPPAGLTLNSWTCAASNGATCPAPSGVGAPSLAGLVLPPAAVAGGPGGQLTFTVQASVDAGAPAGSLTNTAYATPNAATTVCSAASGGAGAATCESAVSINVQVVPPTPVAVPVNGAWALLVLGALVAGMGAALQRRRRT
jgi:uncharacterized repeat protein (TIGR01451 family)